MTYEATLDVLKEAAVRLANLQEHEMLYRAICVAILAVEKQIPKKANLENATDYEGNFGDDVYICSVCGRKICYEIEGNFKENYPYCNCGQALDWGGRND